MIVKFKDVGRGRLCWELDISEPVTPKKIANAIRRKKALLSGGIDVETNIDGKGSIYAGLYKVGTFQVGDEKP